MKSINDYTKKELMSLKHREWNNVSSLYDSVLILPNKEAHDSGWSTMTIIGIVNQVPIEICGSCSDDIEWNNKSLLRMDCALKSKALHFWSSYGEKFKVGASLSSVTIETL